MGCGQDPNPPQINGAIDISQGNASAVAPQDEGSRTQTPPPPPTREQLAEGSRTELDNHGNLAGGQAPVQREIIIPKSVEGKWKAVKILIRDNTNDEKSKVQTVPLGESFEIDNGGITVNVGAFFPNFMMDQNAITSLDNELGNPAVHLVVTENGKEIYKGWTFKNYPKLYAFEHERYSLQLMESVPAPVS